MLVLAMYAMEVRETGVETLAHVNPADTGSPRSFGESSPKSPDEFSSPRNRREAVRVEKPRCAKGGKKRHCRLH